MFLFSLLILLALDFGFYRIGTWHVRVAARHRAMWSSVGYIEANKPFRMRKQRYARLAFGVCIAMQFIVLSLSSRLMGRFAPAIVPLFLSVIFGGFSGLGAAIIFAVFTEIQHRIGVYSVAIVRDTQMVKCVRPLPISATEHGSARVIDPFEAGLTDRPSRQRTIVTPEMEAWAAAYEKAHGSAHKETPQGAGLLDALKHAASDYMKEREQ